MSADEYQARYGKKDASIKSKYHNQPTSVDGINFQSKKEATYYEKLKVLQELGDIQFFLRQVPFDLPGNTKYRLDFLVVKRDGTLEFIDVKGYKTQMYRMRKKQVEALYPIKITEV